MKLLNQDFKRIMTTHKSVKTVLKSANTNVTLFKGFALVDSTDVENEQAANPQVVIDLDNADTFQNAINLCPITCDLLNKCKTTNDVEINDKLLLGKRELPYSSIDNLPGVIDASDLVESFCCSASEFKASLKAVSVCRAQDDVRPVLQDVLIENGTLVAVDGFRIFTRNTNGTAEHQPILLKKHTVDILLKLLQSKTDEVLKIFLGPDNKCCITFGDYSIYDTVDNKEFMKWQAVYSNDFEYKISVDREKFIDALNFVISTSTEKKTIVKFTLKKDSLQVGQDELELKDTDWHPSLNAHFKELFIAFNPNYFIESVKDLKDETITLRFISSLTPCIVEHSKGKDLILPIRLNS